MDGRLQHTVIDDQNTPATGPRSYSTIKLKKGEFFLAEDLTSFKVGDGTKTYESITEDNTYYAGKGAGSAYKFKLNGTTYPSGTLPEYTKDLSNNGIYAPLSGGSGNQVLISLGNNTAPTWANVNISDGLGIINPVGDTYNLILRASSSGHLGGVYSNYSDLFLNNYRVLSSGQSNTDPNYPEVTIFAPTTSTTLASGASISNQLLISQADNQAPIWTGLTLNGSTNGKYLKWDNGWTLDNAGGGTNAYVHIKYANSSNPQDSDMHNIPAVGDKYIGVYSGSASVAPTDHASYVWSKYVGEDGTGVAIKANAESCTQLGDGYIDQNQSSATYGHLMVLTSLSPRTFADAGEIKGPAGEDGATWNSGTYVGNSSHTTPFTSTALTESDVKSGDYYLNSTTYDVYKCTAATNSNSSWSLVCNIKGATGNTGNTGATGNGISSIAGPATSGLHDTYTINFTNGNSTTFTVTNGADGVSIGSISRTSGTGAAGTTDTYTVYDTDGNSIGTFNVYNGADGSAVGNTWRAIKVNGTEKLKTDPASSGNGPIDFIPGNHISLSFNSTGNTLNIAHSDTSSQDSVSNSGRTYIQSIGLDGDGHVTSLSSATETVTNTDRYVNSASFANDPTNSSNPLKMQLTRAGSDTNTITANLPKFSTTTSGIVPVPTAAQSTAGNYYLNANGNWTQVSGGGGTAYITTLNNVIQPSPTATGTSLGSWYAPSGGGSSVNQVLISQGTTSGNTFTASEPAWTVLQNNSFSSGTYSLLHNTGDNLHSKYSDRINGCVNSSGNGTIELRVAKNGNTEQGRLILGNSLSNPVLLQSWSSSSWTTQSNKILTSDGVISPSINDTDKYLKWTGSAFTWGDPSGGTTYSAGTGLSLSGTTFNHSNSITAGSASEGGSTRTLTFGGTFNIPTINYDAQGHITSLGSAIALTLPSNPNTNTTYTSSQQCFNFYTSSNPVYIELLPAAASISYFGGLMIGGDTSEKNVEGYVNTEQVIAVPVFYGNINPKWVYDGNKYVKQTKDNYLHYVNLYDVVNGIIRDNTLLGYLKEALDKYTPKS